MGANHDRIKRELLARRNGEIYQNTSPSQQSRKNPSTPSQPCVHRSVEKVKTSTCQTCSGRVELNVFSCSIYGTCTIAKKIDGVRGICTTCSNYSITKLSDIMPVDRTSGENRRLLLQDKGIGRGTPKPTYPETSSILPAKKRKTPLRYSYGITTVPQRREDLFPRTLASLKQAGFDAPRLFVDGDSNCDSWRNEFNLEVTSRYPNIRTYGNWILALAELYIRDPWADRFAIFQDDFVTYKNLRAYLDAQEMVDKGYWNLYTFPKNQVRAPDNGNTAGWYLSNQKGLGAVALIFSREGVIALLHSLHMIERPKDVFRGWRAVDGGIVTAMNKLGWREYVHNPSLVQHLGMNSSMGNPVQALATSWLGEEFNALDLLNRDVFNETTTQTS